MRVLNEREQAGESLYYAHMFYEWKSFSLTYSKSDKKLDEVSSNASFGSIAKNVSDSFYLDPLTSL